MTETNKKLARGLLWLPAKLYELAVRLRVAAYAKGLFQSRRLNAVVISIGNITAGGTGKTPMVAHVARYLVSNGRRVAILTRGYGRKSKGRRVLNDPRHSGAQVTNYFEFGDEPVMLARALPAVPIVIDSNRYEGGLWASKEFGAEVLILDDGYQHLAVHRDSNLLLLDGTDPFGSNAMLPFGRLREPLGALKRADAVLITRADKLSDGEQTLRRIRESCGAKTPVFYFHSSITKFRELTTGEIFAAAGFAGKSVVLMCGIGNPQAFAADLRRGGLHIVSEHFFTDHHDYTREEVSRVVQAARQTAAAAIVTTEKDAVRLEGFDFAGMPIFAAALELQSEGEAEFFDFLSRCLLQSSE